MSTGDFEPAKNYLQFSGDDLPTNQGDGPDYFQPGFNGDGMSNLQNEGYNVRRQEERSFAYPTDSQGYPVINNYGGTVNVFVAGGNSYSDAAVRADQARKVAMMSGHAYDDYNDSDKQYWAPEYNRLSDFRREALIRDGQEQQRMYDGLVRSNYRPERDPYYDRQFNTSVYNRNGRNINYTHGGNDGFSAYYENGPSAHNGLPPWVQDDCFGTGVDRNGNRIFRDLINTALSYDIARRHSRNNGGDRYAGNWDYRQDQRMNPIEYMLLENSIRGNRWDRNSNRYFNQGNDVSYRHGGTDGFTAYDSTPSWDQYGSGNQWANLLQDGVNTYLAYDIARRSVPKYESHRNVDSYYADNNRDSGNRNARMDENRYRHEMRQRMNADRIRENRERAERRMYT